MSKARSVGRQTSFNRQSGRPVAWGFWLANALVSPDRIRLTYSTLLLHCVYIFYLSVHEYFQICVQGPQGEDGSGEMPAVCESHLYIVSVHTCFLVTGPIQCSSLPSPPPLPPSLCTQGSAAAPIARSVLEFFLDFDIPIYELYGMSESTGPQTLSLIGQCSHVTRTVVVQHTMSPLHTHRLLCLHVHVYVHKNVVKFSHYHVVLILPRGVDITTWC